MIGAAVGGVASWLVARETRKGTIEQAREAANGVIEQAKIGAAVEHARRRDARRDGALEHLVEADNLMGIVRFGATDPSTRSDAAVRAHSLIVRAAVILSDTFDSTRLNELLDALRAGDYDEAAEVWRDVRQAIVSPEVG